MPQPIRAIETSYAGHRFRSRLEARWAVFFDTLKIEWRYEPEGFNTPDGPYLPDFYLPGRGRWIEIKGGSFTKRDRARAAHVANMVWTERNEGFRVHTGDIPRPGTIMLPCLVWSALPIWDEEEYLHLGDAATQHKTRAAGWIRGMWPVNGHPAETDAALTAARSARFEFGEVGR